MTDSVPGFPKHPSSVGAIIGVDSENKVTL
jgi:hypothetical protein